MKTGEINIALFFITSLLILVFFIVIYAWRKANQATRILG